MRLVELSVRASGDLRLLGDRPLPGDCSCRRLLRSRVLSSGRGGAALDREWNTGLSACVWFRVQLGTFNDEGFSSSELSLLPANEPRHLS